MSDVTQSELLINALLDGQLDAGEAERVSKQIANDEQLSEMLAAFTAQRGAVAGLPQYELKDRFADRVLEIAAAEAAARPMLNRAPASSIDWKKYAMSLAAIAGLLMGMLVYQWTPLSNPDGPTVAVLSSGAKPPSTKAQVSVDSLNEGAEFVSSLEPSLKKPAFAKVSPQLGQTPVAAESSAATMRSRSSNPSGGPIGGGVIASSEADVVAEADPLAASALADDKLGDFAFSGTPMDAPQNQTQPAIDQVWLLEINERFSQGQLLQALTSNSISVPAELEQSTADTLNKDEHPQPQDVDGIYVAAKPLQMKNALSQLSQSDAVTISAFQLPGEQARQESVDDSLPALSESGAPPSIMPPQKKAIAQRLRGNVFALQAARPSSMVPESFDKLEEKMGIAAAPMGDLAIDDASDHDAMGDESDARKESQQRAEMELLFPGSELESDRLQNFLILIRNNSPAKK